ncbi:hypothetical protein BD560DRAFT_442615 [Blakeslea trispora]|nr:hypothetical protein BD560DRAFT_442615 [Blakeslea trispora]
MQLFKTWFLLSGLSGFLIRWFYRSLALVLFGDLVLCYAVNRWTSIAMDQHRYGPASIVDQHYYGPASIVDQHH